MRACSKCGVEHDRPRQRYCRDCHAEYMREWRKTHPLTDEQRRKDICRSYTGVLIRRGKITPEPCHCGAQAEAHHPDYANPRLVVWLCRRHHLDLHLAS